MKWACTVCMALAAGVAGAAVPTITLNNGVEMPMVSIGTGRYNSSVAYDAIKAAYTVGFNHIDTANDYGNEDGVGRAIAEAPGGRDAVFVTTKVPGCGFPGVSTSDCYGDSVKVHQDNLKLLNIEASDLLLIHFPPKVGCEAGCNEIQEKWSAMEYLLAQNMTKAIGTSVCPTKNSTQCMKWRCKCLKRCRACRSLQLLSVMF